MKACYWPLHTTDGMLLMNYLSEQHAYPLPRFKCQTCEFTLGGCAVTFSGGVVRVLQTSTCCQRMKIGIWQREPGSFFTDPFRPAAWSLLLHVLPWLFEIWGLFCFFFFCLRFLDWKDTFTTGSKSQSCHVMQQRFWTTARTNTNQNLFHEAWSDLGWFH